MDFLHEFDSARFTMSLFRSQLHNDTPSIPNYKTSQESWRVKAISNLTKIIERNIKIYDIKLMYYENITNKNLIVLSLYNKCH